MTLQHDLVTDDLFGLDGTLPRPGWVVLDAARDRRFTGELVFDTLPRVNVYLDRGRIYIAERVTDPSLGARLVDAGAIDAAQLEHGAMRIGDDEHLGRLFERVPSIDRHAVLMTAELITEECVGWLAHQQVDDVRATPYRHHPAGVHRWDRAAGSVDLAPGDPLPAPGPGDEPVELAAPEPLLVPEGLLTDDMIQWDEPSWLDERPHNERATDRNDSPPGPGPAPTRSVFDPPPTTTSATPPASPPPAAATEVAPAATGVFVGPGGAADDWIERLTSEGLPQAGIDPLTTTTTLPPLPVEPTDRFEVIWPSGEVDEQFGSTDVASVDGHHPDHDRIGPTARVTRSPGDEPAPEPAADDDRSTVDAPMTDEVVLSVRRAIASIESGAAARELAPVEAPEPVPADGADLPTRAVTRIEPADVSPGVARPPTRSVFDDVPVAVPAPQLEEAPRLPDAPRAQPASAEPDRTSALRRLIGSLRRR